MALVQEKKGGPYTKREQEERRLDVYHLHFEEKLPAVTIADTLKVNRNTINEDIKFCREQLSNEFGKKELASRMKKQLHRLEIQRTRFLDYLDEFTTLQERLAIEKSIVNVDKTLNGILSEIIDKKLEFSPKIEQVVEVISDEELKKAIKEILSGVSFYIGVVIFTVLAAMIALPTVSSIFVHIYNQFFTSTDMIKTIISYQSITLFLSCVLSLATSSLSLIYIGLLIFGSLVFIYPLIKNLHGKKSTTDEINSMVKKIYIAFTVITNILNVLTQSGYLKI